MRGLASQGEWWKQWHPKQCSGYLKMPPMEDGEQRQYIVDEAWWSMMKHDEAWWSMMKHDEAWWSMMKHDEAWWSIFFGWNQALWDKFKISQRWTANHPGVALDQAQPWASVETQTRISYDQQTKTFGWGEHLISPLREDVHKLVHSMNQCPSMSIYVHPCPSKKWDDDPQWLKTMWICPKIKCLKWQSKWGHNMMS